MKANNLNILKEYFNVPKFIVVDDINNINLNLKEPYAIRSTSKLEDNEQNSYAGQFDSYLNISKEKVIEYVLKVQKSYKKFNDNTKEVIIQEMIDADFSGVMFTANPIGILNETVIVVGKGLGCNVVEDKVDTSTYYYNQDDNIFYVDGNIFLSNDNIKNLVEISKKAKDIFEKDMDIEFAIKDDNIYVLQARPITTLNSENIIVLDNSNIVESYPGISLPLTQSFAKIIYKEVFHTLVSRLNKNIKFNEDMVEVANGRIYYNINNWYKVLKLLPFSNKIISIWQEMLGVNNKNVDIKTNIKIIDKIKIIFSFLYYLITTPKHMKNLNNYFNEKLKEYKQLINNSNTIEELLNTYELIKKDLTTKWDITLMNDMYTFIYTALVKDKQKISNIKNLESMKPILALNNLVENNSIEEKRLYIELYGDRCLEELKLETKTYRTNPELLEELIKNHIIVEEEKEIKNFGLFIKKAKLGIENREVSRMNRSRIFGLSREIFLKIADILVYENKLEKREDIFYLYYEEINNGLNLKDIVSLRKLEYQNYKKIPNYSRLVFSNNIINKSFSSDCKQFNIENNLYGISSSVGNIFGEVILIENPSTNIDVKDKIIVTKTTDPGWVFLIKEAKGIITEKGSILSHTAIITRELNKPSIVNVKNVTSILKNGDIINMNAYEGRIEICNVLK